MPVGQGLLRGRGLPQDRPARPGDAVLRRARGGADRAHARGARRPLADPVRRRATRTRPSRRPTRWASSRSSRARRCSRCTARARSRSTTSRSRSRSCAPGRSSAARSTRTSSAASGCGEEPGLRRALRPPVAGAGAARHARHDHLPGPGDRGRDGVRRLLARRGGGPAPGDEPQALGGGDRGLPPALRRRRRGDARRRRRDRRARVRDDHRLLGLRLPEGARRGVRAARLPVDLAARALRAGVPVRAAQRAADGVLRARHARARGAAQGDRADRARREPVGGGVHGRRRRAHPSGPQLRARGPQRRGRRAGRRARGGRPVPLALRPRLARRRGAGDPRPPRLGRRLRRARGRGRAGRLLARAAHRAVAARRGRSGRPAQRGHAARAAAGAAGRAGARPPRGVGRDGRRLRDDRADPRAAPRRAAATRAPCPGASPRATSRR